MAAEKRFETKIKNYLHSVGVYPFNTPPDKMIAPPIGYYEKRWGGGQFTKSGLPDLHITINTISCDVEVKAVGGKPSELQLFNLQQVNNSGGIGFILIPSKGVEKVRDYISKNYPEYSDIKIYDFYKFQKLIKFLRTYEPIGKDVVL